MEYQNVRQILQSFSTDELNLVEGKYCQIGQDIMRSSVFGYRISKGKLLELVHEELFERAIFNENSNE